MNYKNNIAAILLSLAGVAASFNTHADITNGDFESWTGGSPDGWTTIDSGISVNQNTTVVKTNTSSAAITVNTGTQSSTDFRQNVDVVAGQTYNFSTWVYHTEGGIRVRLYINGYQNYSSPNLVNQWQQISYSYTAGTTGSIPIGLRFYDVAGFDGSEVVYIDDYQPTASGGGTTPPPPPPPTGCQNTEATLTLVTDQYASETSWQVTDSNQASVATNGALSNNTTYSDVLCLADGDYTFKIDDSYGDGICCGYGNGSYDISVGGTSLISGGTFAFTESKIFTIGTGGGTPPPPPPPPGGGDAGTYYDSITTETGYALKTALHNIIKTHTSQGYGALWTFYSSHSLDSYYENDGTILDIYSENPLGTDPYNYTKVTNQCGTYNSEADCYNREHSFPRSWFGGQIEPMNSDVHHIFASDGFVNGKRSSFPYGVVGSATFTSANNSKVGSSVTAGYAGTVFEPIDEFKGDIARAYFYMATRYENAIGTWQGNSTSANAVLNGTSTQVFEAWHLAMLKSWHNSDPVSQYEIERNNAAHPYQGNRNPFIDHPEWVEAIWGL